MLFCIGGLFTVSMDRVGSIQVGSFNVKLTVILFAAAVGASFLSPRRPVMTSAYRWVNAAIGFLLAAYLLGAGLAVDRTAAAAQLVTVVLGAVLPFLAVSRAVRLGGDAQILLTAFIGGGVLAALYGLYQLASYYLPIPDPLPYQGTGGGQARIASFSYEPAYFGYFLVLVLAAYVARELLSTRKRRRWSLIPLIAALLLCNSRAVALTLPLLGVLLLAGAAYLPFRRRLGPPVALVLGVLGIALAASPGLWAFLADRVGSIANENEPTSNAPRLGAYTAIVDMIRSHWEFGVGPGSLIRVAPAYGLFVKSTDTPNRLVANNIWLQALSDGGVPLAIAHVVLIAVVVVQLFSHRIPAARALIAGWLTIVLVGGMLTSFFYDVKLWVVLGLAAGLVAVAGRPDAGVGSATVEPNIRTAEGAVMSGLEAPAPPSDHR
jgi:hypothetical protein